MLRSQSTELITQMLPDSGTTTLYLGAGHGTTISHLHDHLCGSKNHLGGVIVAVDISPRCVRDLIQLAKVRPGLLPLLADARKPALITPFLNGRVGWLFQDVSQAGQVEMFIAAAENFLAAGGCGLLSLKAASERINEGGHQATFDEAEKYLVDSGLILHQRLNLAGWEDNHVLFHVEAPADWPEVDE
jgi:fibrillarin-like rRNA methylase